MQWSSKFKRLGPNPQGLPSIWLQLVLEWDSLPWYRNFTLRLKSCGKADSGYFEHPNSQSYCRT